MENIINFKYTLIAWKVVKGGSLGNYIVCMPYETAKCCVLKPLAKHIKAEKGRHN
jgi:hypothetical protein